MMNRLHSMIMVLGLCLSAAAVQAEEWSTNLPCFHGGSYSGWGRYAMTEYKHIWVPKGTIFSFH